jgi:predicted nuclease of predicted toxin-antitoxin system
MNLLADESVDRQIVERLRQDGYNVSYVAELKSGITDTEVLELANQSSALLVTADKDFGELIFQHSSSSLNGVLLLRLGGLSAQRKAETVADAFRQHNKDFEDRFSVITSGRVRIQPKP